MFFIATGLLPAVTHLDSDFPNYYTAARLVLQGADVSRLYDDAWFQERMRDDGIDLRGKFSPFPPPTALLYVPLALVPPLTALRIMTAVNCVLLLAAILFIKRCFDTSVLVSASFVLASGIGLSNCFRLGQLYVALSLTVLLSYYLHRTHRPVLAGICLGILIPIKYFPAIFLIYFALLREWKVIGAALTIVMIETVASVALLGWNIHQEFLRTVLGQHLLSNYSMQNSYSSTFQSWDSLLRRLFVIDPLLNPDPVFDSHLAYVVLKVAIISSFVIIGILAIRRIHAAHDEARRPLIFALLGLLALLVAPGTATYHFLLLWTPGAILLQHFHAGQRLKLFPITLMLYIMIGFLPYGILHGFEAKGILTLLAYPRLYLTLSLFLIAAFAATPRSRQTTAPHS